MTNAEKTLDEQFLHMRERCLSLAADLDRVQHGANFASAASDPRWQVIRSSLEILLSQTPGRAERLQMLFSDLTPPPAR